MNTAKARIEMRVNDIEPILLSTNRVIHEGGDEITLQIAANKGCKTEKGDDIDTFVLRLLTPSSLIMKYRDKSDKELLVGIMAGSKINVHLEVDSSAISESRFPYRKTYVQATPFNEGDKGIMGENGYYIMTGAPVTQFSDAEISITVFWRFGTYLQNLLRNWKRIVGLLGIHGLADAAGAVCGIWVCAVLSVIPAAVFLLNVFAVIGVYFYYRHVCDSKEQEEKEGVLSE